ncbi:hypothetical protein ACQPU1_07570 [Clostridium paraputrificum]|uniref:hypothetical protein n=1 Tax=Clostridium paraputrificum TaxID=29363 RepID=UPI003D333F2C
MEKDRAIDIYSKRDLEKALPPVISIINKTEKVRSKYGEDSTKHEILTLIIEAMYFSKVLIEREIAQRNR